MPLWRRALLGLPLAVASTEDHVALLQVNSAAEASSSGPNYFWAGKNGGAWRTGSSDFPLPVHLEEGPAWSWHEEGNGLVRAAPLIDGEKNIYLSTIKGNVYKFSQEGKLLWNVTKSGLPTDSVPDVPALLDGVLYATNTIAEVFALDMESGKELWRNRVGRCSAGDTWSMTAADGVVVTVISGDCQNNNELVGLDATKGTVLWRYRPRTTVYNFLSAAKDGSLVFADHSGSPARLKLATGEVIWAVDSGKEESQGEGFSTGGAMIGPDGTIFVTSNARDTQTDRSWGQGYVTAFDFETGKKLWRSCTGYPANNAAAVGQLGSDGPMAVVIGVGDNPDMPDPVMQYLKLAPTNKKPARILALDAKTGAELWRKELPLWHGWAAGDTLNHICLPDSFGNPALSGDGTVFVGFESGMFYAVKDQNRDGQIDDAEVSSYDTGNAFQGSPGLAPGMVVATPCNGLHVFKTK